MRGSRVQDHEGNEGTVVDEGCGGDVVHVDFDNGSHGSFERVDGRDGEFVDVDDDRVVRVCGVGVC